MLLLFLAGWKTTKILLSVHLVEYVVKQNRFLTMDVFDVTAPVSVRGK